MAEERTEEGGRCQRNKSSFYLVKNKLFNDACSSTIKKTSFKARSGYHDEYRDHWGGSLQREERLGSILISAHTVEIYSQGAGGDPWTEKGNIRYWRGFWLNLLQDSNLSMHLMYSKPASGTLVLKQKKKKKFIIRRATQGEGRGSFPKLPRFVQSRASLYIIR